MRKYSPDPNGAHSRGAYAITEFARKLAGEGITVKLIAGMDPVGQGGLFGAIGSGPIDVPDNVKEVFSWWQDAGRGMRSGLALNFCGFKGAPYTRGTNNHLPNTYLGTDSKTGKPIAKKMNHCIVPWYVANDIIALINSRK